MVFALFVSRLPWQIVFDVASKWITAALETQKTSV